MGCCNSRPSNGPGGQSPAPASQTRTYTNPAASQPSVMDSQTAITSQPRPIAPPSLSGSNSHSNISTPRPSSPSDTRMSRLPLSAHATQPLLPPQPWSSLPARTWTLAGLSRERSDFFDTRVTGRQEIWAALRTATELIRSGELDTAQGILDASGITTPTGTLLDGCYDSLGNLYKLPQPVISDPIDIAEDSRYAHGRSTSNIDGDTIMGDSEAKASVLDADGEKNVGPDEDLEAIQQRREEKGKSVERDAVKVRCRLSDRGGPDVIISLGKSQTVGTLLRRVAIEARIQSHSRVRVAYLGKILTEKETLAAQGWKEGHVLNALVTPLPPIAETA